MKFIMKIEILFFPHIIIQLQYFEDCLCYSGLTNLRPMLKCQGYNYQQAHTSRHNKLQQAHTRMFGIEVYDVISSNIPIRTFNDFPSTLS